MKSVLWANIKTSREKFLQYDAKHNAWVDLKFLLCPMILETTWENIRNSQK